MTDVLLFALVALYVVVSIVCAALARRVDATEERLADMRIRTFALAELLRDDLQREGDWNRMADPSRAIQQLEALFPEIVRFEPIGPEELREQDGAA